MAVITFGSLSLLSISLTVVFPTPTRRANSLCDMPWYSLSSFNFSFILRTSYHIFVFLC
nr:MAG TPA: hypothetical protein [Caudoviricetes sp.]